MGGTGSLKPSPRDERTDSSFRPPMFWNPRSLGAVSVVAAVCPELGLIRRSNAPAANGTMLDRSVVGSVPAICCCV